MDTAPRFRVCISDRSGVAVVVKAGEGPAAVAALRREAAVLDALRHPGVVELLAFDGFRADGQTRAELTTRFVGTHTFHTAPATSPHVAIMRAGQVLATLAALHGRGLVHGAVDAAHVVVGPNGGARWCGLGGVRRGSMTERMQEARATVPLLSVDLARARPAERHRRRANQLLRRAVAVLDDDRLDAAAMASSFTRLLSSEPTGRIRISRSVSAEADRHLVGEQPTGDGQHEMVAMLLDETVEDSRHLSG